MKIAILAWGSLVWNPETLAVVGNFEPSGPHLPIEFSRVSGGGRLTLVIDEIAGTACSTYYALSEFEELQAAIENLREREKMPNSRGVGFVNLAAKQDSDAAIARHPQAVAAIKKWAAENGLDAVIWTALASNFHEPGKAAETFTSEAAVRYLEGLDEPSFGRAIEYIRQAPPEVRTPVRTATNIRWPTGP